MKEPAVRQPGDETFIQALRTAACSAAHQADLASAADDLETVYACVEAAYVALDEMHRVQRLTTDSFPMNDNVPTVQTIEAHPGAFLAGTVKQSVSLAG